MLAAFALADRLKTDVDEVLNWPEPKFHHWLAYCELYAEKMKEGR